ncbi:hypothetical protein BKA66DRAFT_475953 [Pyrenochaeta sp. MPI-SDFR-AT-0127]|nr:hypothetical protein BKA66DRAFT_475953 [Pyrenochaeta sp. MPI-SDFR-AT-0127]
MHSSTFICAVLGAVAAPLALAQSSSITRSASMVPVPTPSAPPVTMAWDNEPTASGSLASDASSLNSAMQSAMASMSMEDGMTMSDGSVMPASAMSGMSGMATGTGMAGMDMSGAAGRPSAPGVAWSVGIFVGGLGLGAGVLANLLA